MPRNKRTTAPAFVDPDDAPDLSTPYWRAKFDAVIKKQRGRPKVEKPKVSTTIRLDADVLEHFRRFGIGWQSRINATLLREAQRAKAKKRA